MGARCGAGAGSPRLPRPHPGHTGRGTPAARPRGQAAGGGTAPDTKRTRNGGRPTPRGRPHTIPAARSPHRHAGQGGSDGPPHPHARAHSMWVTDFNSPPSGRAVGGGGAPDLRRPSQQWRAPLPGTPFRHPHSEQRRPAKGARCGTAAGSPRPHRPHPDHTGRGTPAARPRGRAAGGGTAPETRRPPEKRQATPPGEGPPPLPRHAAPTRHAGQGDSVGPPHPHARAHSTWVVDPNSPPSRRTVGGGGAPDIRQASQQWKAHSGGRPSTTPTASNGGPQGRTLWGRCWVPTPAPTAPGTHWSRNPRDLPQRADGWGRDSI